ncbi:4'-phosphopantetheinyl transferase family protein [Terracidiphilus sp.]|jgi:4'-phosphopantetheinyl transferase|uniref:4'-phosphopantetheinyl transferase family protein n=1 Tax=Terracidiphilus sp. TaxID=1964191 RepID=UPI003C26776B
MGTALNLWYTRPENLPAQTIAEDCERILSEEEFLHSKTFRFERHRREYLATRLLVRTALSHYHPLPPHAWKFQANPYGKPAIDPDCGLRFNLSNCAELVVCLIGKDIELGIDIEPFNRAEDVVELASDVFSPRELAQLESLSEPERRNRALSLWTLKESYIKARGLGLSLPLKHFSFVFEESNKFHLEIDRVLDDDDPARWQFRLFNLAEHRAALAVESRIDPHLHIWEAQLPTKAPIRQPDAISSLSEITLNM